MSMVGGFMRLSKDVMSTEEKTKTIKRRQRKRERERGLIGKERGGIQESNERLMN